MPKEIFVFNGIHGSGKSTVARAVARQNAELSYFYEVGGKLRAESKNHSMTSDDAFDRMVLAAEVERDQELLASPHTPVVETWHVGNMAFILTRLPEFYDVYAKRFEEQLKHFKPHGIILDIGEETFRKRSTEKLTPQELDESVGFYHQVRQHVYDIYDRYAIPHTTINNETPLNTTLAKVEQIIFKKG